MERRCGIFGAHATANRFEKPVVPVFNALDQSDCSSRTGLPRDIRALCHAAIKGGPRAKGEKSALFCDEATGEEFHGPEPEPVIGRPSSA